MVEGVLNDMQTIGIMLFFIYCLKLMYYWEYSTFQKKYLISKFLLKNQLSGNTRHVLVLYMCTLITETEGQNANSSCISRDHQCPFYTEISHKMNSSDIIGTRAAAPGKSFSFPSVPNTRARQGVLKFTTQKDKALVLS